MTLRKMLIAPLLLSMGLLLTACGAGTTVGSFLDTATTQIANPITTTNIYQAENAYAATLTLAVAWRKTCYSAPYATLMANPATKTICQNRRSTVRRIQSAKATASTVLAQAEAFAKNYPTMSATALIATLWDAVKAFRSAVPGAPPVT